MQIDHVGVLVGDLEQATTLARDVLGLGDPDTAFEAPEHGLAGAFFGMGGARLELFTLAQRDGARPDGLDHLAVVVEDLDAVQAQLAARGVRFTGPATAEHVDAPVEVRGKRHLWTDPATSGGFRIQLTGA